EKPVDILQQFLTNLNLHYTVYGDSKIPQDKPLVFVSNHPMGLVEAIILFHYTIVLRSDCRAITNGLMPDFPRISPHLLRVDVYGKNKIHNTLGAMKNALQHLRQGGSLFVFPSGQVGELHNNVILDTPWSDQIT